MEDVGIFLILLVAAVIMASVLFAPTIIAFAKNHPERWSIFGLNFSVGGNSWGWGAALTWALQNLDGLQKDAAQAESKGIAETVECPRCAETIKAKASVCKHCGYEIPESPRT